MGIFKKWIANLLVIKLQPTGRKSFAL